MTAIDHWKFFNWANIIGEAKMLHEQALASTAAAITPEMRTLEYWTAHCAHANMAACMESRASVSMIQSEPYDWRKDPTKNAGNGY